MDKSRDASDNILWLAALKDRFERQQRKKSYTFGFNALSVWYVLIGMNKKKLKVYYRFCKLKKKKRIYFKKIHNKGAVSNMHN